MKQRMDSFEQKIDKVDKKLDELIDNLLHPDQGFVTRINKNTEFRLEVEKLVDDIYAMKRWRDNTTWVIRALVIAVVGALVRLYFML